MRSLFHRGIEDMKQGEFNWGLTKAFYNRIHSLKYLQKLAEGQDFDFFVGFLGEQVAIT